MAESGAIRAGRAFVEVFADNSELTRGLALAQARLRSFATSVNSIGRGMVAFGASILTPLAAMTTQFVNTGEALDKMSQRTGVSVEALSELGFALDQAGGDLESFETGAHDRRSGAGFRRGGCRARTVGPDR